MTSDRYSRQPPTIAPNRFAAKAEVGFAASLKREVNSRLAKNTGANASTIAQTSRAGTGSVRRTAFGTRNATASEAKTPVTMSGRGIGLLTLRVVSIAASTARSTPVKTSALTSQVVPNSSAKVAMFLVSSSMNAAPMKNRSAYGRISRNGPPSARTAISEKELKKFQVRKAFQEEVATELKRVQSDDMELAERASTTRRTLELTELRAPVAGTVTSIIAAEPRVGEWREYVGGFYDWQRQSGLTTPVGYAEVDAAMLKHAPKNAEEPEKAAPADPIKTTAKSKLSFKEQKELEELPITIANLENEQNGINALPLDGQIFVNEPKRGVALTERLGEIDEALLVCLERWEALEARK